MVKMYRGLLVASLVFGVALTSGTYANSHREGNDGRTGFSFFAHNDSNGDWRLDWLHGDLLPWRALVRIEDSNGQ
jgi:hypothetical protein